MFFSFFLLLSLIPLCVGITIFALFEKNNLSKNILFFLIFGSFWQIDVSFLYSHGILSEETILILFKLFRFGTIMVTPLIFYIGYTIVQEVLSAEYRKKWRYIMNSYTVVISFGLAAVTYIVGWTDKGVSGLELIHKGSNAFYFPIDGELSWVFSSNLVMFFISIMLCLFISLDVENKIQRSFLIKFIIFVSIGSTIGFLNMFSVTRLLPSSIAILVFAISALIISIRMHTSMINQMNKELNQQKKFLFQIVNLNPNYIYAQDEEGRYTLINESYARLMGKNIHEMIGKTDDELQNNQVESKSSVRDLMKQQEVNYLREDAIVDATGKVVWVQTAKVPIQLNDRMELLAVSTDITSRKQYEDEIKYQAYHDALTGLQNRRMFNEDLMRLLEKAKAEETELAIVFLDLDRFKYINDTLGHDVGDLLLIDISRRMKVFLELSYPYAKIYRLGGDEFTFILPNTDAAQSETFAQQLLEQYAESFMFDGIEHFITPSIGISVYPNDGDDARTLIRHADTAMYAVKASGKENYQLFSEDMQLQVFRKMIIENQLRTALENEEFELYYQPIMDLKTNEIVSMEALLRWRNDLLGQVSPEEFIPIAEETNMIVPIGQWVLETAIEQSLCWQKLAYKPLRISVNISVRNILEPTFIDNVRNALLRGPIDPSFIVFEITESIAMYEDTIIDKLYALKGLGISLSMDDFGTGYSSLSYLNKYPLNSLKIDKSFVMGMNKDAESKAIVKTIVTIAKQLNLKVIAEGVESEADYRYLAEIGCDYGQGYYIDRPLPVSQLEKWITKKKPVAL